MAESQFALATVEQVTTYLQMTDGDVTDANQITLERMTDAVTRKIERVCDRRFAERTWVELINGNHHEVLFLKNAPLSDVVDVRVGFEDAMSIDNSDSTAVAATVRVTYEKDETDANIGKPKNLILTITGGTNASSDTIVLTTDTTLALVNTAINAIGKGWSSTVLSDFANTPSNLLREIGAQDARVVTYDLQVYDDPDQSYWTDFNKGSINRSLRFGHGHLNVRVEYTAGFATIPEDLIQVATEMVAWMFQRRDKDLSVKSETIGDYKYEFASVDEAFKKVAGRVAHYKRIRF